MGNESTDQVIKLSNTVGKRTSLPSLSPRANLSSQIKGLISKQSGISRLIHTYSAELNQSLTLGADELVVYSIWSDGTKLYAGVNQTTVPSNGALIRINLENNVIEKRLAFPDGVVNPVKQVCVGDFIYVACVPAGAPGKIIKVRKSDFTIYSTLELGAGDTPITDMVTDGSSLYCSLYKSPAEIVKVDIATFLKVGASLVLTTNLATSLFNDSWYLYVRHYVSPGVITQVDLDTFTEKSTLTLGVGTTNVENKVSCLAGSGGYLYAGLDNGQVAINIVKIYLVSFTELEHVTLDNPVRCITVDGTYLYAGLASDAGVIAAQLISIELATLGQLALSAIGTSTYTVAEGEVQSIFTEGSFIYTGMSSAVASTIHQKYIIPESNLYERRIMYIGETVNTINENTAVTSSGKTQLFEKVISSAANAGLVTVGSVNGNILIKSIVIYARSAQTLNMTSCAVYLSNGISNVVTFINSTLAVQANLNDVSKQVSWDGAVVGTSISGDTILINLLGTGAAAVDLLVVVEFISSGNGGEIL